MGNFWRKHDIQFDQKTQPQFLIKIIVKNLEKATILPVIFIISHILYLSEQIPTQFFWKISAINLFSFLLKSFAFAQAQFPKKNCPQFRKKVILPIGVLIKLHFLNLMEILSPPYPFPIVTNRLWTKWRTICWKDRNIVSHV